MAATSSISPCVRPKIEASLSCGSKVFIGLRAQPPNCCVLGQRSTNAEFHNKVHKSIHFRSKNKPTRGRVTMMPIGTPRVPYKSPGEGRWQWVDLWNALYRERIIFVGEYMDEEYSNQILATMLYLDSVDDSKKLLLYIGSPGGDLTPSMALYDTMQSLKSPVGTHCMGYAFNLAAFLLAAGDKGSRSSMPASTIVLQAPAGNARGQADDIRNEAEELLKIRDYLFKELAKNTGQPLEKIYKDLSRAKHFNGQSAVEYGLVDRVAKRAPKKESARIQDSTQGLG